LGVGFDRCEEKSEKSAPKFISSSNYHKEEEALKPTKTHYPSNLKLSFKPKRDMKKETPSLERKFLFAYFVAVLVTWMSFAFIARELRRDALTMLEAHPDEFSNFLPHSYSRALPCTSSHVLSHFSRGPNHRSYGFGSRENNFVPRCFSYDPHPHRDDHFPRRPSFSTGGSHTHFELRHLEGPRFHRHGSCSTRPNSEVQWTVKTSSGRMVKC
jgi:hypothetical protein